MSRLSPSDVGPTVGRVARPPAWPTGGHPRRGFALLLTLTLVSFIVLLLVGLATYTRVETAIAGNSQRQAQARENALFALNVAVGQLQKQAGPDTRATATAETATGVNAQKRRYTGVWSTTDATEPPVWLVSGLETGTTPAVTGAIAAASQAVLVGTNTDTSAAASNVVATLQAINAPGIPGQTGSLTVGRYAWWVGDQGVKAPVAVADSSDTVNYAPFGDGTAQVDLGTRIRQQMALGAGAATTAGAPSFEPRDANNRPLVADQKVGGIGQFSFLRTPTNGSVGLTLPRQNFHTWSANNYAVLANTKLGGLRQDLSLQPTLLGKGFATWANYDPATGGYMENVAAPATPVPAPALTADPIRRRYVMQSPTVQDGVVNSVVPVLSYFLLSFNVRTQAGSSAVVPLEARARWLISLWNPYSAALVPEDLRLEVSGLPTVTVDDDTLGDPVARFPLESVFGSPLNISLPWASLTSTQEDHQSWLPGRVYTWSSLEDTSNTGSAPAGGYVSSFDSRNLNAVGGQGVQQPIAAVSVEGSHDSHLDATPSTLTVTLYAVRAGGDVKLGTFTSPDFDRISSAPQKLGDGTYQFSFPFRLAESIDTPAAPGTWLSTAGRDVRQGALGAEAFVAGPQGPSPDLYPNYTTISEPDRLLDRAGGSLSYNEDVPLFELPRSPLLSLGAIQHLPVDGQRPFLIGNTWAGSTKLNSVAVTELFDRYFFSGLVNGIVPATTSTGDLIVPNQLLKPLRKTDRTKVAIEDVRALLNPPTPVGSTMSVPESNSFSSQFFLQGGAFNLNSTNTAAWVAVLRGVRFPAPQAFTYLNADTATGTAADNVTATVQSTDAQFFRFSQSAQETYKADPGQAGDDASVVSLANTHLFRRGMRTLTAAQLAALATKVRDNVVRKQTDSGPFRSLEEFLSPNALFAGLDAAGNAGAARSLLEAAIADAGVNDAIAEFSSQFLTQADIMTALAPVLFPRSDTFIVRTYGEAVNPATNVAEGRAWCEAVVQRLPDYFDATQPPETAPANLNPMNTLYGRRFKVVSFRWLTRSDI